MTKRAEGVGMFHLTRRAANASWSDRTAQVGRPKKSLAAAVAYALAHCQGDTVTISEPATGLWGTVARVTYADRRRNARHIILSFPCAWLAQLQTSDGARLLVTTESKAFRQPEGES